MLERQEALAVLVYLYPFICARLKSAEKETLLLLPFQVIMRHDFVPESHNFSDPMYLRTLFSASLSRCASDSPLTGCIILCHLLYMLESSDH